MLYEYQATVHTGASERRLRMLVRRLQAAQCEVQFDREAATLRMRLRDSEDVWMQTALVTMLLLSYNDVVSWAGRSQRVEERPLARQLPATEGSALRA